VCVRERDRESQRESDFYVSAFVVCVVNIVYVCLCGSV